MRASAVAEDDPGPPEPVGEADATGGSLTMLQVNDGVDVGALGPSEGEMLGLAAAADTSVEDAAASANHAA